MASRRRHSRGLSMTSKDLPRMRRLQKSPRLFEMANHCNHVDEHDIGQLLEGVHEELTNKGLEQKRIAEEEAREKETAGEDEYPRKFTVKCLAEDSVDLKKLLKIFENMYSNTKRFSLIKRNVHSDLSAYKQIYDEKRNKPSGTYF
ncbi:hypothetical protein mRhiFer1_008233 [Rhinolophus ferrumequinum]|uniref:Uncharacterized protein n=1 Tax=Rhinolophus ferrumequinum TaxID=59479 RepID=A0A7J7VQT3_RHIFE|nr:hypothetical protein mRhiFer1_008233 [Rhinolophus ferrumequinum]